MPEINELVLRASGRRRRARLTLTGTINYEDSDLSRNGVFVNINVYAQDGSNRELIRGLQIWTIRGRVTNGNEGLDQWSFNSISPIRTSFEINFSNENAIPSRRSFNEDRPGGDEVFCWAQLRDANGTLLTLGQDSNTVNGMF